LTTQRNSPDNDQLKSACTFRHALSTAGVRANAIDRKAPVFIAGKKLVKNKHKKASERSGDGACARIRWLACIHHQFSLVFQVTESRKPGHHPHACWHHPSMHGTEDGTQAEEKRISSPCSGVQLI